MANFALSHLQLKFGPANLARYTETMAVMRGLFENEGVRLRHGAMTTVGPLWEVWNLWEFDDPGHFARAVSALRGVPEVAAATATLAEIVESEDIRFLQSLPYSPE